jgi:glycosyltransferase involved in cell wall biosynthesis
MQKNNLAEHKKQKLKVVRVVTASYVVPWHLGNTLKRISDDFEVCVVGQDVSIYRDCYPDIKWVDIDLNRKISLTADLLSLYQLCRFFLRYKPDIVHSIMPKAGLLSALAGIICRVPIRLHTFTGQVWATKKTRSRIFLYAIDKLITSLNTVCLTDSPSQSQFLYEHGITKFGKPLPVLGRGSLSGVDLQRFDLANKEQQAKSLCEQLGIHEEHFIFAFIARKTRDKGAIDIINAFSRVVKTHPHSLLLFVGPDESEGRLEKLTKEMPELFHNVLCMDRVNNHELFLAISHVLCLPSYREGFGTIVIDAAALSVPTIGSNIVGLVDSVENNKTGILFPVGDIDQLTAAMLSFLETPSQLKTMGEAARQRVESYFSADKLYAELKCFYLELVSGR